MALVNKQLIAQWGENTAYSAKGHFKSADIKSNLVKILLGINLTFAVLSIIDLPYPAIIKLFGVISLIASIYLLIQEVSQGSGNEKSHLKIGDQYLTIHYKLQEMYFKEKITKEEFDDISNKIEKLNQSEKPRILQFAKRQAEKAIMQKGEMKKWWNNK